ncbi:MAG: NUDIX domain-containing protein [Candidatus Omnitrophica bacterium]|nr:NUDIX domain-containing protein [Candidatus Omnitrophota bacterium]
MKKELAVAAALIKRDSKFLLCQRNPHDCYSLLWEFPGGAIEAGETNKQAIEREIAEELGLKIEAKELVNEFFDEDQDLIIKIFLIRCQIKSGKPKALDCNDFGFFSFPEAEGLALAPADKKILAYLKEVN